MTTVYCPMKACPFNDAKGEYWRTIHKKEGICIKAEIEMGTVDYNETEFSYCKEYEE